MKNLRVLLIVCAIFLLPQAALAATADNAAVHTVSVQGSAALAAAPDQASIAIGVTSNAATAAEAQQKTQQLPLLSVIPGKKKELVPAIFKPRITASIPYTVKKKTTAMTLSVIPSTTRSP